MELLTPTPGSTFGNWTVISGPIRDKYRTPFWLCRCVCGTEKNIAQYRLINNPPLSCGCLKREVSKHTKELLSARRQGQPPPRPKGSKASEETKQKMSEAHKLRHAKRKLNASID